MALGETVVRKKAEELELEGLHNVKLDPACLTALDQLLLNVYEVGCPELNEYYNRWDLVRIFNVMAKEIYGSGNEFPVVEAFGSFLMDVFSVKSDLDLSVNFSDNSVELPRDKKISALRKFARRLYQLQSQGHVYGVHPIVTAKVPIVKVIDRGTGIACDISVENKDGVLKSQIIHIISAIDYRFQKLSFLMKTWAKVHSINSSKDHTLNSLSIILLVAFHLQTREPPILPPFHALFKDGTDPAQVKKVVQGFLQYGKRNEESLAELFVAFLSKMASVESLWLEGLCVSTYEGTWISRRWEKGCMNVEDFTDRSQNVARAVGKAGVKLIYQCIHCSLHDLLAFNNGYIEALKLKAHLFDVEQVPTRVNPMKKRKRALRSRDSLPVATPAVVPMKKMCSTEGSNPWEGGNQASSEIHRKMCSTEGSNPWEGGNQASSEIHGNMSHKSSPTKKALVTEGSCPHGVSQASGVSPNNMTHSTASVHLEHCPPSSPPVFDHGWHSWKGTKQVTPVFDHGWRSWGRTKQVPPVSDHGWRSWGGSVGGFRSHKS